MAASLNEVFDRKKALGEPILLEFVTCGFPSLASSVDILLGLQDGGVDIIELGIPHSDPLAEGPTIQKSSDVALKEGVTPEICLQVLKDARKRGLTVPVVFMGYYNPIRAYGEVDFIKKSAEAGAQGFIVVDLPPEESSTFVEACRQSGLAFIPLVSPNTTNERIAKVAELADAFIYVVSVMGVTGSRVELPATIPNYLSRVSQYSNSKHTAIGFGVSTPQQFQMMSRYSPAVVIGSALINYLSSEYEKGDKSNESLRRAAEKFTKNILSKEESSVDKKENIENNTTTTNNGASNTAPANTTNTPSNTPSTPSNTTSPQTHLPSTFGPFGGRFAPESLTFALDQLETSYASLKDDPDFIAELAHYADYVGRETPLYFADRLTAESGGAQIWFKREDMAHTGAHKINNAIGQALMALRLGKKRIIAETGAGQHGVATATVCAKLGLECIVYMGAVDMERQALNVFRMKTLGAKVVAVRGGSQTLKDAVNEAMRDWVANLDTTHYIVGSAIGPHPFPTIVRDFQSIIGKEARSQMLKKCGRLPDVVMACVGGGSNSIGMFHPFINDESVKLVGVEAAGHGVDTDQHCATLVAGTEGIIHGTKTLILQDANGQIAETHSISAGLDYPGVGPEHAWLKVSGRATYVAVTDEQALQGFQTLSRTEGILPALETSHAIYHAIEAAKKMDKNEILLVCLSGRGDKDMNTVAKALGLELGL